MGEEDAYLEFVVEASKRTRFSFTGSNRLITLSTVTSDNIIEYWDDDSTKMTLLSEFGDYTGQNQ